MRFYRELRRDLVPFEDHTSTEIYVSNSDHFEWSGARTLPDPDAPRPAISLIATVLNEVATIDTWLESLVTQSRLPDEIVIVDGGSEDGTLERLEAFAARSIVPTRIFAAPRVNIAQGRNLAIEHAAGPIIACTDAGCLIPPDWLAAITGPFAVDRGLEVVAGYYGAAEENSLHRVMAPYFIRPVDELDPKKFLPSARSMAFCKEAWSAAGKFPEWLTMTAEDTLFALALKKRSARWAFVPEAKVRWRMKSTIPTLFRQVRSYVRGDGEAGAFPGEYWQRIRLWIGLVSAALLTTLCLVLALLVANMLWLFPMALPVAWLVRRLHQITLRPAWAASRLQTGYAYALSTAVILTITLAMAVGFIEGTQQRGRRNQGLVPDPHGYELRY